MQVEVFNIVLVWEHGKHQMVHCMECALQQDRDLKDFACLEERSVGSLIDVYDGFKVHQVRYNFAGKVKN